MPSGRNTNGYRKTKSNTGIRYPKEEIEKGVSVAYEYNTKERKHVDYKM